MPPAGLDRAITPGKTFGAQLARLLTDIVRTDDGYEAVWTRPNRRLISVYPNFVLPAYEPADRKRTVLIALDTSGSVQDECLEAALAIARQPIPDARVTLICFDVQSYQVPAGTTTLKGGGGTRVQAVEEYARNRMRSYPDSVVVLTDGQTPSPTPMHPERWVWLLLPGGTAQAVPKQSCAHFLK